MTIGNILSRTRNTPAKMTILLLALLPVSPKLTGESAPADEAQRHTNAHALSAVFDLVLAPLQELVQKGTVMDRADGKTRLCFPILSAEIADHAEHAALHGIGSKSCPKCEVPSQELGENPRKIYEARQYPLYWEKAQEQESGEAGIAEYFQQVGVKIDRNVFTELYRVNPADLYKPDLLHNIYLGLFIHMMESVEWFLKRHKRSRRSTMPGKDLRIIPNSVYQKGPIVKSHNGRKRKCPTSADAFQQYWRLLQSLSLPSILAAGNLILLLISRRDCLTSFGTIRILCELSCKENYHHSTNK